MATSDPSPEHIVLIGMMGAGKTSVGKRLAERLDRPFFDVDSWIEDEEGVSIADLFATRGEVAFRELEARVLPSFLSAPEPCVLSVGGGAVLEPRNREVMDANGYTVVWLRARPETLHGRIGGEPGRPLLTGGDPAATLTALSAEREPLYTEVADLIVDVDGRSVDDVVDSIAEAVT